MQPHSTTRILRRFAATLSLLLIALAPWDVLAHEIPNDVRLQAFIKPAGRQLQLLLRVPLAAMQEVDFPRRGSGWPTMSASTRRSSALPIRGW